MNEPSGKKSLIIFLLCFLGCVLAYLFLFYEQFGPYIPAEYWLRNVAIAKQRLCQRTPSPKAVILSGSNALFGFDSRQLEHFLGRPVINFGLHAGLPLGYLLNRYNLYLRPGDMVIMPFEYELYETAEINTSWFTTQVIAWDKDYFDQLSIIEKIRFIISVPPLRLLANLANKFLVRDRREVPTQQEVMDTVEQVWRSGRYVNEYHLENLNNHGDMERRKPIHIPLSSEYTIYQEGFRISDYAKAQLSRFFSKCRREGVTVVVTWPSIIYGGHLEGRKVAIFMKNIRKIETFMASSHVAVAGNATNFSFPEGLFYDTSYHLGQEGRQLRTLKLADFMLQTPMFRKQTSTAAKHTEIKKIVSTIRQKIDALKHIRHLYWDLGRESEAVQMVESGIARGYLNEETAPIILNNLYKNQSPSLHAHITEMLASPMAGLGNYEIGNGTYLIGTTPDGWTTDGMPGYFFLKAEPHRRFPRKICLTCNAPPQALPLTVTLQGESEKFCHTFDHPGEIEIALSNVSNAAPHLYIVSTDKYWVPGGPDNRKLGVQIRIE